MLRRACIGIIVGVARRARPLSVVNQEKIRAEADMKAAGIVLTIVGALMLLSGVNLALTKYDLKSSHGLSMLFGGVGLSAIVLLGGVVMINKARSKRAALRRPKLAFQRTLPGPGWRLQASAYVPHQPERTRARCRRRPGRGDRARYPLERARALTHRPDRARRASVRAYFPPLGSRDQSSVRSGDS
jgi:hypothetical protein